MADLIPQIGSNAASPASASGDGQHVQQQPLNQQIAADRYQKAAGINSGLPFRTVKLKPGNNADIERSW